MIYRKKIEDGLVSWHMILLSVLFVLFLAASVVFIWWYLFSGKNQVKIFENTQTSQKNVYVDKSHSLTNVMIKGLFNAP